MAECVVRCAGVGHSIDPAYLDSDDFRYLRAYDPKPEPTGSVSFTTSIDRAMRFPSMGAAMKFVLQVHPTNPTRPDGRPNKPLTAWSWLFESAEVAQHG